MRKSSAALIFNRRSFVFSLVAARLIPGGLVIASATKLYAQAEVGAVLAVLQFVSAISGMLGRQGDQVGSLIAINTQMLQALTAQVSIVQKSLELILLNLVEIGRALRAVPEEVVVEEFKGRISGAMTRYVEMLQAYNADLTARGVDFANTQNRVEFNKVIDDIREARSILFGYENEIAVPVLAAGMQCEIICMILVGERDSRVIAALDAYIGWFARWLGDDGPLSLSAKVKNDTEEFIKADEVMRAFASSHEGHGCVSKGSVRLGGGCHIGAGFEARIVRARLEAEDVQTVYRKAVEELKLAGAPVDGRIAELVPFDFFETVEGADMVGQECSTSAKGGTISVEFGAEAQRRWGSDIGICESRRVVPEDLIATNQLHVGEVRVARDRVLMRNALLVAASEAARFSSRMKDELLAL